MPARVIVGCMGPVGRLALNLASSDRLEPNVASVDLTT